MKKYELSDGFSIRNYIAEIQESTKRINEFEMPLKKDDLLDEDAVCDLLSISKRTLYSYRKRKQLHCIKLSGRILFLKHVLYLDLVELSLGS